MAKKKACKRCKIMVDGDTCPICKGGQFAINWKGRVFILSEKSEIGKKTNMTKVGEYAIKVT